MHQDLQHLKAIIDQHSGRLNTLDQRSAHTQDQVQKQQQLEASKQAIISNWPDSATPHDRTQAVEYLVARHDHLKSKYVSTTTLRTKTGTSQFSIVDFYTKEARNDFLDLVKKESLTCNGQIAAGRAQIPKSQREADQPLRCAIAVYSQVIGKHQRYKPTWEMSAVWHDKEWILSMQAAKHDQTRLTIYVPEPLHDIFREHFATAWQQWGQQKGSNRRADGYKPQDFYQISGTLHPDQSGRTQRPVC